MLKHCREYIVFLIGMCACSMVFSGQATTDTPLPYESRPWCIGRFVFDRPATSEISNQRYAFRGEKLETEYGSSEAYYQNEVNDLDKKLRASERVNPGTNSKTGHAWLEKTFSPRRDAQVFVYREFDASSSELNYKTEGYFFDNGNLFRTSGRIGAPALGRVEDIYNDTYRRIKTRDNWSVPTESGFCFDGGIITGSSTYTEEVSQSFALMPRRPALLVIQMRDAVDPDQKESLSKTLPQLRAQMDRTPGEYRILRQGKRVVAGMDAEEVLFELREGGITSYHFYLLAPGAEQTLAKPHTEIQLLLGAAAADSTPDQATSPVDESGAIQLWDTLLNSLRLRPGAV
jgi:hypothetical protein